MVNASDSSQNEAGSAARLLSFDGFVHLLSYLVLDESEMAWSEAESSSIWLPLVIFFAQYVIDDLRSSNIS